MTKEVIRTIVKELGIEETPKFIVYLQQHGYFLSELEPYVHGYPEEFVVGKIYDLIESCIGDPFDEEPVLKKEPNVLRYYIRKYQEENKNEHNEHQSQA